eukprot:222105_1
MGNAHKKKQSKEHSCAAKCLKNVTDLQLKCVWHPSKPSRWEYTENHHSALKSVLFSHNELNEISDDILEIIKLYILNIILSITKQEIYYKHIRSNIYHDNDIKNNIGKYPLCHQHFKRYNISDKMTKHLNVGVLGAGAVGKRLLCRRISGDYYCDGYDPHIEDSWRKMTDIHGLSIIIDFINSGSNDAFQSMLDCWIRECESFWLCFDVMRRKTFDRCIEILYKIIRNKEDDIKSVVFVGCKNDKRFEQINKQKSWYSNDMEIDTFDVMKQVEAIGDFPYIEISSKAN